MSEHRVQSGFANTDLHHQPKEHTIKEIAIDGMVMNACIESTGPAGTDRLLALVRMRQRQINDTTFGHALVKTSELLAAISKA